jgi:hypothetical protein
MRPPPLAAFSAEFVPPVTGVNGSPAPVANLYDTNGVFQGRGRANSVKRRRVTEEIDAVYDLSANYPPLTMPQRPMVDLEKIKGLLVAAGSAAEELKVLMDDPNLDPRVVAITRMNFAILDTLNAVVECGLMPISGTATGRGGAGGGGAVSGAKTAPATAPKPAVPAGLKELREGLERADRESILFDADLGAATLANRSALAAAFSSGIRAAAIANAENAKVEPAEAVRIMNDVISCVNDMEFVGAASKKFLSKNPTDERNNKFCTMPIRFKFDDRNTRIHFETSMKKYCNLRATISLPRNVREEQTAFQREVKARYPDEIVTVRPDIRSLSLRAFRKVHGQKEWTKCPEFTELLPGTLLPGYKPRVAFNLPPAIQFQDQVPAVEGAAALVPMAISSDSS